MRKAQANFGGTVNLPRYKRERIMRILDNLEAPLRQMGKPEIAEYFIEDREAYTKVCEMIRAKAAKLGVTEGFRWKPGK